MTSTTADLSWTENGTATQWQISYATGTSFAVNNGTKMFVTSKPYTVSGLQPGTTYTYFVRSICGPNDTSVWSARSASFTTLISCPVPTAATATNITLNTADLSWTGAGSATQWQIEYATGTSFTPGSGSRVTVSSKPYTLPGLAPSTQYSYFVRSVCGAGDTSVWSSRTSFATACPIFTAPFTQAFGSGSQPVCWTNTNAASSTSAAAFWKFSGSADYGALNNGRANGTYAWVDASSPYNIADVTLTSPQIDLTGLTAPYLQFDWLKNNTDPATNAANNDFRVEINNGGSWAVIYQDSSNIPGWRMVGLPLSAYANTIIELRFIVNKKSNSYYDDVALDSIVIKNAPSCPLPSTALSANVTATSADLSWTENGTATQWQIEYGPGTFTLGTGTRLAVSSNPNTLTGLQQGTAYSYFVRAICGAGDTSFWSTRSATFTTLITCPVPTALTASSITANSADLGWTENGTATQWEIEYNTGTTFALGTGTRQMVATNPYHLTNLAPSNQYSYFVRAICGAGDTSIWSARYSFTTPCVPVTNVTETFTSYLPSCWTEQAGNLGASPTLTGTSSAWASDDWLNAAANGKAAKINLFQAAKKGWLISPSIDLGAAGGNVQFDLAIVSVGTATPGTLGSDDTVAVVISTDDGATW